MTKSYYRQLAIFILFSTSAVHYGFLERPHSHSMDTKTIMWSEPPAARVARLAQQLIRISSVTPHDKGCQEIVRHHLEKIGFYCETLRFENVTNLWALRHGVVRKPLVVFAGHTDVVPTGPLERWTHPPFDGIIDRGTLYGRGAVDMKGGVASFVIAVEEFVTQHPQYTGSIGVLLTSDEEGPAIHGTRMVVDELERRDLHIDMGIVGEPSSTETTGDAVKVGRRGSLGGELTIHGIQGHVAYPELSRNPIHESLGALKDLVDMKWDAGTADFKPTTFQITNINSGTGATNVVPGFKKVVFNFRFSPASTPESLQTRVAQVLKNHNLEYDLQWENVTYPYETSQNSPLVQAALASVHHTTGLDARICTSGGTSDGRFLAAHGAQVVELGLVNKMIHKIDEHVDVQDLAVLTDIYQDLLQRLLVPEEVVEEEEIANPPKVEKM